jgi:hypothetical protein
MSYRPTKESGNLNRDEKTVITEFGASAVHHNCFILNTNTANTALF